MLTGLTLMSFSRMNSDFLRGELTRQKEESVEQEGYGATFLKVVALILDVTQHVIVGVMWASVLYTLLYVTGVINSLMQFGSSFRYQRGVTPLTSVQAVVTMIGGYVLSLPLLQWVMKNRKPIAFPRFMVIHNLFLMTASACLSVGISYFVVRDILKNGFYHSICSADVHDNPYLHLFYYINYLLKFYEFLDTYIIILKKKPVIFLHWYHHAITALLTYIQQNDYTPVQWVPIVMNLVVHVVMYSYYLLSSFHFHVWWKRYLTLFQIVQFIVDLSVCGYCTIRLYDHPKSCVGTIRAAYSGMGIIGSYFFLFLNFYRVNYKRKSKVE